MATLGQAYVQIVPSAEGISNSISGVLEGPADAAGKESGKKFGTSFGNVVKGGMKTAALGIGAAMVAGSAALGKSIADVTEYGDHVDKMSQKIGMSREGFQKWDYVLKRAGTSVDSMAPVMKKLSTEAANNSDAFKQLGISQEDVANMSQEELFGKTIEALSGMEEGAERTALASKLLGRGATELAPLLNGGTDAIKEQMEMAEKYGMVLSDDSVKAAADFADAQTTLQGTLTGFKNRVAAEFLPACTDITNGLAKAFSGDMSGLDDIRNGIGKFVSSISEHVPEMVSKAGELLAGFIKGVADKLPELAKSAADAIREFASGFGGEGESEFLSKAGELIVAFGGALLESAAIILPAVGEALISFFTNTDWIGLGAKIVTKVHEGFRNVVPKAISAVGNFVKEVAKKLGFSGLAANVKRVFDDVKNKITEPIDKAKELVNSAIETIKSIFPISIGKIFSGIQLPYFKISGGTVPWGIGGAGTPPSVGVEWHAKGGIMTKPVLFGGGEAGREAILPLDSNTGWMDELADRIGSGQTNIYVTVNGAENPEDWARRFAREYKLQARTI